MLEHVKELVIAIITIVVVLGLSLVLFNSENIAGQAIANSNSINITISNSQFNPPSINVEVGDRIVFVNLEDRSHKISQIGCTQNCIETNDFDSSAAILVRKSGQIQYTSLTDPLMIGIINSVGDDLVECANNDYDCLIEATSECDFANATFESSGSEDGIDVYSKSETIVIKSENGNCLFVNKLINFSANLDVAYFENLNVTAQAIGLMSSSFDKINLDRDGLEGKSVVCEMSNLAVQRLLISEKLGNGDSSFECDFENELSCFVVDLEGVYSCDILGNVDERINQLSNVPIGAIEASEISKREMKLTFNEEVGVPFFVVVTLYDENDSILSLNKQRFGPVNVGEVIINSNYYDLNLVKKKTAVVYDVLNPQIWKVHLVRDFEVLYN